MHLIPIIYAWFGCHAGYHPGHWPSQTVLTSSGHMDSKYGQCMVRFINEALQEAKQLQNEHERAESAATSRRSTADCCASRRSTVDWLASGGTTADFPSSHMTMTEEPVVIPDYSSPATMSGYAQHGWRDAPDGNLQPVPYQMLLQLLLDEQRLSAGLQADLTCMQKKMAFSKQQLTAMYSTEAKLRQQLAAKDKEIDRLHKAQTTAAAAEASVIAAEAARKRAALEKNTPANQNLVRQKSKEISHLQLLLQEQRQQLHSMTAQLGWVQQQMQLLQQLWQAEKLS